MITITAKLDDYSSLDGRSVHRFVQVKTEHEQVHIKTDDGEVTLSRDALKIIGDLIRVGR